jgi:nitroreductase
VSNVTQRHIRLTKDLRAAREQRNVLVLRPGRAAQLVESPRPVTIVVVGVGFRCSSARHGSATRYPPMSHVPPIHTEFDAVLTTTRSVRLRMDLTRPVPREVIEQCVEIARQAPSGGNRQDWRFLAVDEEPLKRAVGDIYHDCFVAHYGTTAGETLDAGRLAHDVAESAHHLAVNLHRVPAILVPYRLATCPAARSAQASFWASILPAAWSFMLAARSRGLVTALTTRALDNEAVLADVLGIDYPEATIAGLIAVGYPDHQRFSPARRGPLSEVMAWNS